MQIFSALHSGSVVARKSLSRCDKVQCNVLAISILYDGKIEGFECGFPCFLPEFDAVFHARKIAKRIGFFSCFTQFWACNEAYEPHFSALYTPKLHLCTLVPLPVTLFVSYPKTPFGMSHFAIWGILRRVYAPILAPFYPLFALISSHFRGKNVRQNACLSPQLSGNQTTRSLLQCPHAGYPHPPGVIKKLSSSPFSLQIRCSLNPKNQPIEHFPPPSMLCL